ncbi:MAG TPA: FtsX-like permease family protein, partial [Chitinophagaceae bacterium]
LGFKNPEQAVGKDFQYDGRKGKLAGVFSDFNFESMHQKIVPLILLLPDNPAYFNRISIKIAGSDAAATLQHIENAWKRYVPQTPYEYTFLDDSFATLYSSEQRQKTLFSIFSCLAIFIGCLGLFGLSAFAISQRIREIGIRKVLGANVSTIVSLLSKDFLRLVAISAIIAVPAGWFFMSKWLEGFAYRISLGGHWWIFPGAAFLAMVIALITISFQAIRAALANPVRSLRTE